MATGNNESTKELALVKKGNNCLAIAERVCCDVNNTSIDDVEQKLKILKTDAEELADHAEEKAKEIEKVEEEYKQEIQETQRKRGKLIDQEDELKMRKSEKEDSLADKQSALNETQQILSNEESELSLARGRLGEARIREERQEEGTWSEVVYGFFMGFVRWFGAADGSGEGASLASIIDEVATAQRRVDSCKERCQSAKLDVQSTEQEISGIQSQINDLTTQIANLNNQQQQYAAKAKKMSEAVVFFRKTSQFWREFKQAAEKADMNTELMQVVVSKAKEKQDLKWLSYGGSIPLCLTFLEAWKEIETKCEESTDFEFQKIEQ